MIFFVLTFSRSAYISLARYSTILNDIYLSLLSFSHSSHLIFRRVREKGCNGLFVVAILLAIGFGEYSVKRGRKEIAQNIFAGLYTMFFLFLLLDISNSRV